MVTGKEYVAALAAGEKLERAPFIPILGGFARQLGQATEAEFAQNPQSQASALVQAAAALSADAITVAPGSSTEMGLEVCRRLSPVLSGRALVACITGADVSSARAYCEAGVDMLFVISARAEEAGRFRTLRNVSGFYRVPVILVSADVTNQAEFAAELKLDGAIVPSPSGQEPGIIGGGLGLAPEDVSERPREPRRHSFFWSFPGELAPDSSPEVLVRLGKQLAVPNDEVLT